MKQRAKNVRFGWLALTLGALGMLLAMAGSVSAQTLALGPAINIPDTIIAAPNSQVAVPIQFTGNGHSVAAIGFRIVFDTCLSVETDDGDFDGIPDGITNLVPGAWGPGIFMQPGTTNQLNFSWSDNAFPISAMPDITLAEINFTTCAVGGGEVRFAPVDISDNPAISFGDTAGQDIDGGTADGGRVVVVPVGVDFNADLAIEKIDVPDPARAGGEILYTVTATNNGPLDATNVTLVDDLPAEVTFVRSDPGEPTCTLSGTQLTCDLETIASGASVVVKIVVATAAGTDVVATNTVTVSGGGDIPDDTPGNDTKSITTNISTSANVPSLSQWGLISMAVLIVIVFTWRMGLIRRRTVPQAVRRD